VTTRIARLTALAPATLLVASALAGCHAGHKSAAPTTVATTVAPPTTVHRTTTTTAWKARAPQATPDAAASVLVQDWSGANRSSAALVASPRAVATLFSVAYPGGGLALSRGCSAAFPPIVCTYGPPGGANPNDAIFELYESHTAQGWYVASVTILP
jgi:hypothetical protein